MTHHLKFAAIAACLCGLVAVLPAAARGPGEAALAQDMQQKSEVCKAVSPMTRPAQMCAIMCTRTADAVTRTAKPTAEFLIKQQKTCDDLYAQAGPAPAGPPVPTIAAPTLEDRIAAMPGKSAYCAAKQMALDCTINAPMRNDYMDETGACFAGGICENYCARSAEVVAGLADPVGKKGAAKMLANCEQNYDRLRMLSGDADE
jgi:hypothetical protein